MKPNFHVVIPLYNEEGNVRRLLESLQRLEQDLRNRFQVKFLLIDDGSTDATVPTLRAGSDSLNVRIVSSPVNRGPGSAFATAFAELLDELGDEDFVLTSEGDNTSRLELVQQMIKRSEEGFDVIFASPHLYGGGIINTSLWRVLLSAISNLLVKEFLGLRGIMTVSSFFRLYRGSVIRKLSARFGRGIIEFPGFECMLEMSTKLMLSHATISEVAMVLDTRLRAGKSKMKVARTIMGYARVWVRAKTWKRQASVELRADSTN